MGKSKKWQKVLIFKCNFGAFRGIFEGMFIKANSLAVKNYIRKCTFGVSKNFTPISSILTQILPIFKAKKIIVAPHGFFSAISHLKELKKLFHLICGTNFAFEFKLNHVTVGLWVDLSNQLKLNFESYYFCIKMICGIFHAHWDLIYFVFSI